MNTHNTTIAVRPSGTYAWTCSCGERSHYAFPHKIDAINSAAFHVAQHN